MVKRIVALFLLFLPLKASASLTLLSRELFASNPTNVIYLSSTNLNSFNRFYGTLPIVAQGANTNGATAHGWSGLSSNVQGAGAWSSAGTGMITGWFYFTSFAVNSSGSPLGPGWNTSSRFFSVWGSAFSFLSSSVDSTGTIWVNNATNSHTPLSLYTWNLLTFAWRQHADKSMDIRFYVGTNLTTVYSADSIAQSAFVVTNSVGVDPSTSGNYWLGRVSGVSLYRMIDFTDVAVPADMTAPPSTRSSWYVNPSTGNDLFDGASSSTAWASEFWMRKAMVNGTVMANPTAPWAYASDGSPVSLSVDPALWVAGVTNGTMRSNGDAVYIDTSITPLEWTDQLLLSAADAGVEITSATSSPANFHALKTIAKSFSQYDSVNFPNVWTTTDCQPENCLWESRKWMNNPLGANITAVRTNLNANPGSFWTDGTTLYFSSFDGSDPNVNAFVYERSRKMTNAAGGTGFLQGILISGAPSSHIHNFTIGGFTYRNQSSGACEAVNCVQAQAGRYGAVGDCRLYYGGNHAFVTSAAPSNGVRACYRMVCDQWPPWTPNSAGYSCWVENHSGTDTEHIQAFYADCNGLTNSVIGSSAGALDLLGGGVDVHGTGSYDLYDKIEFDRCVMVFSATGKIWVTNNLFLNNCYLAFCNAPCAQLNGCHLIGQLCGNGTGTVVSNCVFVPTGDMSANNTILGAWTVRNCTFDMSKTTNAGPYGFFKAHASSTVQFTNSNNAIYALGPFISLKTNDTCTMDNNAVVMANDNFGIVGGGYKTWAQWKALGFDAHSVTNVNLCLDSRLRPYAKTPCWNTGIEAGPAIDYTGKLFQSRRTCGAYEYAPNPLMLWP